MPFIYDPFKWVIISIIIIAIFLFIGYSRIHIFRYITKGTI